MRWLADLVYLSIAILTAPIWLIRMVRTGKIRTDWRGRLGFVPPLSAKKSKRVLLHAVSVGEINAIRSLVDQLSTLPEPPEVVIATTTDTGYARAQALWGGRWPIARYPFDFSFAVNRFLRAVDPDVAVLVELEVWPNFTAACKARAIPVCVINGRLTERSFQWYWRVRKLIGPSFARLSLVGVQNDAYAHRFRALGVPADRLSVTGTIKWDSAQIADQVPGAEELARDMGIDRSRPLIVGGSTAPGEHELLLNAKPASAQLLCAPRKPEWFEQAASVMNGCVRRSSPNPDHAPGDLFLLDTIGELRKAYALADIVVIGRSFGDLFGSDMIEPVALGKPTIVGPAVDDFRDVMDTLLEAGAIVQTNSENLPQIIYELLASPQRRADLISRGRAAIRAQQGATNRSIRIIQNCLATRNGSSRSPAPKPNPPSRLAAVTAVEEKEERL